MNREIKFRAKDLNGKWVYGLFGREKINFLILPVIIIDRESDSGDYVEKIEIDGKTLSQFTGLKDKNGREIYEGDILNVWIENIKQAQYYKVETLEELYYECNRDDNYYRFTNLEVIGNIYENPELIEA